MACSASSIATPAEYQGPADYQGPAEWMLGLGLRDVHHPVDAELVSAHAEFVAPHLLLQRHGDRPGPGQLLPVAVQGIAVVPRQADRNADRLLVLHVAGRVRAHDRVAGAGLQLAVHDLVRIRRLGHAVLPEGGQRELATEDALVELHRLAGIAV